MSRSIISSSERSKESADQISFIVRYRGDNNHIEYEYDLNTKFGKIREDMFMSPFNHIDQRDRFGLEFSVESEHKDVQSKPTINTKTDDQTESRDTDIRSKHLCSNIEQYNHMDLFTSKDLDLCRLSTLKLYPGVRYVLTVYDRAQTTTVYADRLYRIFGSIIIICLGIVFNGVLMRSLLWLVHLLLKLYRLINDPYTKTKKIRCDYGSMFNNGMYEWMFMGIMCYDMYFGSHEFSSYSAFCNIGAVLCLYHIFDMFKNYHELRKSNQMVIKSFTLKINLLEILFMISQCMVTWSPYPFIYSVLNVWLLISDLMTEKNLSELKPIIVH